LHWFMITATSVELLMVVSSAVQLAPSLSSRSCQCEVCTVQHMHSLGIMRTVRSSARVAVLLAAPAASMMQLVCIQLVRITVLRHSAAWRNHPVIMWCCNCDLQSNLRL
jgi:hypothetical protein